MSKQMQLRQIIQSIDIGMLSLKYSKHIYGEYKMMKSFQRRQVVYSRVHRTQHEMRSYNLSHCQHCYTPPIIPNTDPGRTTNINILLQVQQSHK
jgi:hypothetical protein